MDARLPGGKATPRSHNALLGTSLGAAGPGSTGTDWPLPVPVSFLLGSLKPLAGSSPQFPRLPPRPWTLPACLQTYSRAGAKPVPWGREPGVVGTAELGRGGIAGTPSPSTCGVFGATRAAVAPRLTLHGYGAAGAGGPTAGGCRSGLSAAEGVPWRPGVRNLAVHPGCLDAPESLTCHFLCVLGRVGFEPVANLAFYGD